MMYYAFYTPNPSIAWKGKIELRGLEMNGQYKVFDYEHEKDLGTVSGQNPTLTTTSKTHLLLEVSRL